MQKAVDRQHIGQNVVEDEGFLAGYTVPREEPNHTITVLEAGHVAEQGTHEQLMAQRSLYRDIYELQLRPQEEIMLDGARSGEHGGII